MRAAGTLTKGLGADQSLSLVTWAAESGEVACSPLTQGQKGVCQPSLTGMCQLSETSACSLHGCEVLGSATAQTPKRREREGMIWGCRCALRCPLPGLIHDGDHEVEKAVGHHLCIYRVSQVGRGRAGIHDPTTCPSLHV